MRFLYADPDNFKNIREYTNSKLMGNVVDGETDADAAYLEAYPGTHLKTLIDFINEFRRTDAYQNLKEAITDSGATPQIGVIVGETNKKALKEGLREELNFSSRTSGLEDNYADKEYNKRIFEVIDLEAAKSKLSELAIPNSTVLLENDLPDHYF